jgi:predicted HTH domain antitoxin
MLKLFHAPQSRSTRFLWLLEEVRSRRLGFGKAAEIAGLPQARFLALMGRHRITPFDYDEAELSRELSREPGAV